MKRTLLTTLAALATVVLPSVADAATVDVEITGEVEFNSIGSGPFADVVSGDPATITFQVDSELFTDSPNFPTRGYDMDLESFVFEVGPVLAGLEDPFPAGLTPYFVLRNDDPAVDGFWTSTSVDFPLGVPTDVAGAFGQFKVNFQVTYEGFVLDSLDILDALGAYDFANLTVFNFTLDDGPFMPMGLILEQLTISLAGPSLDIVGDCPGSADVTVAGATPDGEIALAIGSGPGTDTIPAGACAGTELGLADPALVGRAVADASGALALSRVLGMNSCGAHLQVIDLTTCETSTVVQAP